MIEITCSTEGFRRAGIKHPKGTTSYQEGTFSDEQLEMMAAEPKLIVSVIGAPEGVSSFDAKDQEEAQRFNGLLDACKNLDSNRANSDDWTSSGKPQIGALERISGLSGVTAAERDEVLQQIKQSELRDVRDS